MKTNQLDFRVIRNFTNIRLKLLLLPFLLLGIIVFILLKESAFSVDGYVAIQKDLFFYINSKLAQLPSLQYNLTQLVDALIVLPLLTVFIVYAPKIWGALLTSSLISLILTFLLKTLFSIPRPAVVFDHDSFAIIGKPSVGYASLPSGHTITIFTVITTLLFAFLPRVFKMRLLWLVFMISLGLIIAFSRVGVGAHYPLDVIIGSIIGYIFALLGIVINNNVSWWNWIKNKKYYPIFMVLLPVWIFLIIKKMMVTNLVVYYFSVITLVVTLYLMINIYVKEKN